MFKIGMEIILESKKINQVEKYRTRIEDLSDTHIYISYPINMKTNKIVFLHVDEHLNANFVDEETNAYSFKTQIVGKVKNKIPLLLLPLPSSDEFIKIQRRQFVRVYAAVDIALEFPDRNVHYPTITEDISAGGCSVHIPRDLHLQPGELIKAWLILPLQSGEYVYIHANCHHIRSFEKNKIYLASLQFFNLADIEQQHLIRFTFEKQLEYKKRGIMIE